jgi:hypothetical protein
LGRFIVCIPEEKVCQDQEQPEILDWQEAYEQAEARMIRTRNLPIILSLLPLVAAVVLVFKLAVEVPYLDEWEMVPLLQKSYEGHLQLTDFWAQHSEHRPLVSRIILLLLARLTHWNMHYEFALNIVLAAGIAALLAWQINVTARKLQVGSLQWIIPAVFITVFSIASYENWLWGWQMALFLSALSALASILLLANAPVNWLRLGSSIALGVVATYSLANGMLIWPIGLGLLLLSRGQEKGKAAMVGGWVLAAILIVGSYFIRYYKPPWHPPINTALNMPVEYVCYVLKYLGGICAQYDLVADETDGDLALACGAGALVTIGWVWGVVLVRKIASVRALLPYAAMSSYSLGTAILSGVGRVGFGSNQALASRYCTLAAPFWISLIVMLGILLGNGQKLGRTTRTLAQWSLALALCVLLIGSALAVGPAKGMHSMLSNAQAQLLALASNPASVEPGSLISLYPRPEVVIERYPFLVRHRLSVFRTADTL